VIEVRGVTKYYGRTAVLNNVSMVIHEGTQLGLIGPGGAGKTLLIKIMSGLVKPDAGQVFVDGEEVTALGPVALAKLRVKMGMLFQNYALFDFMNVEENIAFPLRQKNELPDVEIRQRVAEILTAVDLPGIQKQYPNELSGGMKKRVTFARAVIHDPPILFYDDPTAGLDPVTSSKIFILLERRRNEKGTTSVVITHDILGVKDICDEFAMLDFGRLIFRGTREEIEETKLPRVRQFWEGKAEL
jgi:phospholipid/cholesterol/gamma-HCH transport system ATP-binding protein